MTVVQRLIAAKPPDFSDVQWRGHRGRHSGGAGSLGGLRTSATRVERNPDMNRRLGGLRIAFVILSVAFAHAEGQTANPPESEALAAVRRAIDKGNAEWSEGWAKGDAAMVAAIFADDGVQLASSGKLIKGRRQIQERQSAAMQGADAGVKVTVTTVNVWLDGDTAYETGRYKYEYTEKGKPGTDEGRYVTIWKRQRDGSWKLSMDIGLPKE
jgi:uncharacterized protein (TIGR02246 family)